ncbi:cupin domain-containing protein [Lacibacter sp.]|uniref:cupin domain-containing protein n=1 Tax=Lacibacter sp. TaxID=1915409 RepID=UPI002B4B93FD|nr:cupin domain-containing protein [Lacibacter sp.]HLP38770.1 cupin domain-containing protein [Lacibacter sp.]
MPPYTIQSTEEPRKNELPKLTSHIIVEIVEYIPDSIVSKTVIKKSGGDVTATSVDEGEEFCETIMEFDIYVQVIDGKAEVTIDKERFKLNLGEGIILPANVVHCFYANEQFKMITTMINNNQKEVSAAA